MRFVTLDEAARRLRISFGRALELVRAGRLPARLDRGNARWFVSRAGLDAYQRQQRQDRRAHERVA